MADEYARHHANKGLTTPSGKFRAITPHDSNEIDVPKAIYVGGAGTIVMIGVDDSSAVTFTGAVAGTTLPLRPKIVKATGTTATGLVALY